MLRYILYISNIINKVVIVFTSFIRQPNMLILGLIFIFVFLYFKLIKPHNYWKSRGVPYIKPWPIFGNFGRYVLRMSNFTDTLLDLYTEYPNKRYVGIYQFLQPALLIRDPDLIKKIAIKEFDTFSEQTSLISEQNDNLAKKTLLYLNQKTGWQDMRSILSPAFTSSKMRMIFTLMDECGDQLVDYLSQQKEGVVTREVSNTFNRISNDVIASTAFGVQCNSLIDENNEFYVLGKNVTQRTGLKSLLIFVSSFSPIIAKLLNVRLLHADAEAFFSKTIKEVVKHRKENNVVRHDMLHLLLEARKNRLSIDNQDDPDLGFAVVQESQVTANHKAKANLTDDDITAQAMLFFIAGFEGTSTALSHVSYALAVNPDVQHKLRNEIEETLTKCNGKITYEALMNMKYLDCVVSENARYLPSPIMNRKTAKPFTIEPELPGETPLYLEKGTIIWMPIWGLHHDAKYHPNPEKFDPERFNDKNKHNIIPNTYLPFGAGPRNCIGSRFALLQIKLILVKLVKDFDIVPVKETVIPFKPAKGSLNLLPTDGVWLGFAKRT